MSTYHEALRHCADRYLHMQELAADRVDPKLFRFTLEFQSGCRDRHPVPKLCRWLGYIQGLLIERGLTTVEIERDWTRPLFRPLDYPPGPALDDPRTGASDWSADQRPDPSHDR